MPRAANWQRMNVASAKNGISMASPVSPIVSDDDQDIALISNEISASTPSNSVASSGSARSDSPLRKRARYDSTNHQDQNIIDERIQRMPRDTVRDDTYYLVDGSCVLLADDTLFNVRHLLASYISIDIDDRNTQVHRTILSKDCSFFSVLFTIPQGHNTAEGTSDAPIILTGDTPSEFRNFLWALYALPHELMAVHTPRADLNQLIDIARISNKYSFKSLETWSLDAIQEYVNRKPSPLLTSIPTSSYTFSPSFHTSGFNSTYTCSDLGPVTKVQEAHESTARITKLIRLAQTCSHDRLLTTLISLLRQLMSLNIQYAYLAMTLADELELRALRGAAYLEVMSKSTIVTRLRGLSDIGLGGKGKDKDNLVGADTIAQDEPDEEEEEDTPILTPSQRLRLLSGYYRLTHTWDHLRTHPPPFDHAPTCGATWHQHGCTQSWVEFWKEKTKGEGVVSLGMADVLGRLRAVQKEFDRWGSATYMHHDCRMSARRGLAECVRRLEESLPDYFEWSVYFALLSFKIY
jgi:hypothetical protein